MASIATPAPAITNYAIPNIVSQMLWSKLLHVQPETRIGRLIATRDMEPFLARAQIDIELLTNLTESTQIQDTAPIYPFLFKPSNKSSFVYVGTNDTQVALKMVLWQSAVETFNHTSKYSTESLEYKQNLARAFQLASLAQKAAEDHAVYE